MFAPKLLCLEFGRRKIAQREHKGFFALGHFPVQKSSPKLHCLRWFCTHYIRTTQADTKKARNFPHLSRHKFSESDKDVKRDFFALNLANIKDLYALTVFCSSNFHFQEEQQQVLPGPEEELRKGNQDIALIKEREIKIRKNGANLTPEEHTHRESDKNIRKELL